MSNRESGFSLIEVLTVLIMVGVLAALALPRLSNTLAHQDVRAARNFIIAQHARARALSVTQGRRVALVIKNGELAVRAQHPVTGVTLTIGKPDTVTSRYDVTLSIDPSSRDTLVFNSKGTGQETSSTTIIVTKRGYADTLVIGAYGRITH